MQTSKIIPLSALVHGKGADISKEKQFHRWAEEKLINDSLILSLVDIAKNKGDWDRWKSYWNTWNCLRTVVTSEGRLYGKYCKNRTCAICCGIRKAGFINTYLPIIKQWEDPFTLVLTVKNPTAENLKKVIDEMFSLIKKIIAKYRKRSQRKGGFYLRGIKSFECTYNPRDNTYHPHFHFIIPDRQTGLTLQSEWIKEGRKTWGQRSISASAQCCKRPIGGDIETSLVGTIKYSTKIFTENDSRQKKQANVNRKIYIDAYDNIITAMRGRRIFDRFGLNLAPKIPKERKVQFLKNYKEWIYSAEYSDWLEVDGALTLTNYVAPLELRTLLKEAIA